MTAMPLLRDSYTSYLITYARVRAGDPKFGTVSIQEAVPAAVAADDAARGRSPRSFPSYCRRHNVLEMGRKAAAVAAVVDS